MRNRKNAAAAASPPDRGTGAVGAVEAGSRHDPVSSDGYLYDFFKYLTSISLLVLAGILTVSQMAEPGELKPHTLLIVMGPVAASALIAFTGAGELVKAKVQGKAPGRKVHRMANVAAAVFLVGIGAFLFMFMDVMY